MEGSSGSQQNPQELQAIGEESTNPRPTTDQDIRGMEELGSFGFGADITCLENQCQTVKPLGKFPVEHDGDIEMIEVGNTKQCSGSTEPLGAKKKNQCQTVKPLGKFPVEHDGDIEMIEVGNTEQCSGSTEPLGAKKKNQCQTVKPLGKFPVEHDNDIKKTEVGNPKQCSGFTSGIESSTAVAKWEAKKKSCAVEHEDVTRLPGEEEEDRNCCSQEKMVVDDTDQCHESSTALAKQQQQRQQQQQQQKLPLQQPASHPQLGTMSSQPQSSGMTIYRYQNHAIWYFHRRISQSEFLGRTWSNACTFIALFMAKLFSIHNNATVAVNIINEPSYPQMWLGIVSSAIQAGNSVHDSVTGGQPINFSVVDAIRHLNGRIGKPRVVRTLDVGFTNEDPRVPQSSLSFHLELLSRETSHIAAMVIVNRMTICFVARGGKLFVLDSHAHLDSHSHLPFGAMVGVSDMSSRESFLAKVKQELHLQYNLCSLTFVKFL